MLVSTFTSKPKQTGGCWFHPDRLQQAPLCYTTPSRCQSSFPLWGEGSCGSHCAPWHVTYRRLRGYNRSAVYATHRDWRGSRKERSRLGMNAQHVFCISRLHPFLPLCPLSFNNNGAITFLMIIKALLHKARRSAAGKGASAFVMWQLSLSRCSPKRQNTTFCSFVFAGNPNCNHRKFVFF